MTDAEATKVRRTVGLLRDERDELRTAITQARAMESIGRKLGDDLIAACRELVAAWHARSNNERRMRRAVHDIEQLVGRP